MKVWNACNYGSCETGHNSVILKFVDAIAREVEGYAQCINRCEEQISLLYDEVEELRDRLGLDPREPICIEDLRHRKALHINQDRALNRVLHKEVHP